MLKLIESVFRITFIVFIGLAIGTAIRGDKAFIRWDYKHQTPTEELEVMVDLIYTISGGNLGVAPIPIGFIKRKKGTNLAGACHFSLKNFGYEVDIVKEVWDNLETVERLILVSHELIHCECASFGHVKVEFSEGCYSVMNDQMPSYRCVKRHLAKYLLDIRRGCGN